MNEFDLIHTYLRPLARHPGALNLTDDAALLEPPAGCELVISADTIVENVHYIGDESPAEIARKLLRVNLSDLAAKGASPIGYMLTMTLPKQPKMEEFFRLFCSGLAEDQEKFGLSLLGGDTTSCKGNAVFSATVIGSVKKGTMLKRSGAKEGDVILVSGPIGDGALGLKVARKEWKDNYLLQRYRLPEPRLGLGQKLHGIANACMDISDGLVQDLGHICAASGMGARINEADVPFSDSAKKALKLGKTTLSELLTGGDDYELLFTVSKDKLAHALACAEGVTVIGEVTKTQSVSVIGSDGNTRKYTYSGYAHFG